MCGFAVHNIELLGPSSLWIHCNNIRVWKSICVSLVSVHFVSFRSWSSGDPEYEYHPRVPPVMTASHALFEWKSTHLTAPAYKQVQPFNWSLCFSGDLYFRRCVCVRAHLLHICIYLCICVYAHVQRIGEMCLKCRSTKPSVAYFRMALFPDETEREWNWDGERGRERERARERERERELRDRAELMWPSYSVSHLEFSKNLTEEFNFPDCCCLSLCQTLELCRNGMNNAHIPCCRLHWASSNVMMTAFTTNVTMKIRCSPIFMKAS